MLDANKPDANKPDANKPDAPGLSSLGIPSGVDKGPSRGQEDIAGVMQLEELNNQLKQAKLMARASGPSMAHPYLNAVLGIVANAVDPQIAGPAFEAAGKAHMAPAIDAYNELQATAKSVIDEGERRQKAFQNILASNPEALIPMVRPGNVEDMKQLGLATFGIPIPIDPAMKSDLKLRDLQRKNQISYHLHAANMAMQAGNNTLAEQELTSVHDLVDPDGESNIAPGDLVNRKKAMSLGLVEVTNNYEEADQAAKAWIKFQMDGDHPAFLATLSTLHARRKSERAETRLERQMALTGQLAAHMRETSEEDQDKALKGMPEDFQLKWEAVMPKGLAGSDELSRDDYMREQRAAWDDAQNYARSMGIEMDEDELQGLATNFLRQRLRTQERLKAQANRSTRKVTGEAQANPANKPAVTPISVDEFRRQVSDYITAHQEKDYHAAALAVASQLGDKAPLSVRKKLGI